MSPPGGETAHQGSREVEPPQIGHIPLHRECKACGYSTTGDEGMAFEPCADQAKARELVNDHYMALPSSPEGFDRLVKAAGV